MNETYELTITRNNPEVDPYLHVWGWPIPGYLFLGGLTAGILILSAVYYLMGKEKEMRFTVRIAPLFAPAILGIGLFLLWLDLAHKLYFWRLYLSFQWTSPMSWGSWILILVFPTTIIFALLQLDDDLKNSIVNFLNSRTIMSGLFRQKARFLEWLIAKAQFFRPYLRTIAIINIGMGIFVGIYTGILLSSFIARPFWNTPILGFLFLASGLSAASAFNILGSKEHHEEKSMVRLDMVFLIIEIALLIQIFIGYMTQSRFHNSAGQMIFGGDFTGVFWMLVILQGILFPLFMETMELFEQFRFKRLTALSVLLGGLLLRILFVVIGQYSSAGLTL